MELHSNTFKKEERLCSKMVIDQLFVEKRSCFAHPFRFVFLKEPAVHSDFPCQIMFSVPKRNFKRAVKRNLIKRRMRESYRLNKSQFYQALSEKELHLAIMVIYIEKEVLGYTEMDKAMRKGLAKLIKEA
jgi:ribonuclease P protein component